MVAGVKMWRSAAFLAALAWMLSVGIWANSSWTESVPLATPPGAEAQATSFLCSAPFDTKAVEPENPANERQYPVSRQPCEVHGERRALAIFDLGLGLAVLTALIYLGARRSTPSEADAGPRAG